MAENGAHCELPQLRLAAKEQHNGQSADSLSSASLVLWKKPLVTLHYFLLELLITLLWRQIHSFLSLLVLVSLFSIALSVEGKHQKMKCHMSKRFLWCSYWVGLGNWGLGPHIASVILAAYECSSVDFPEPPYPEKIISAVQLSGADPDDKDYEEFGELLEQYLPLFFSGLAVQVQKMVQRVGFVGILVCASVTTLIGKAIVKMHIRGECTKLFVIITFSRHIVEQMVSLIGAVPGLGASLQKPFREYLEAQRVKMHHCTGEGTPAVSTSMNWLLWVFEKVIVVMVCFFVCSIVNSTAQSYAKCQQQQKYYEGKTK
uniref:Vacuole membrane protein 1 n=1 Tax=Salmo trutta TaxID=8032 RepID=A0A673ZCZ3_SALTR